ncbi:MAG: hypothetical protein IPO91_08735 [Chloroflexi bacterium]|nr:hypothetical protein [Chloroflexota bacterium]
MIYDVPPSTEPIRQGDIFRSLPFVVTDPESLTLLRDDKLIAEPQNWINLSGGDLPSLVVASVVPTYGIVITQDCDTTRDKYIAFLQIREFFDVVKDRPPANGSPEKINDWWTKYIVRGSRENLKWFYLPADPDFGFDKRMAATFQTIITVRTDFLVKNLALLRMGRLNTVADEHFREQIAQYFRRYPYNEWYPFTKDELSEYRKDPTRRDTLPYPWQE